MGALGGWGCTVGYQYVSANSFDHGLRLLEAIGTFGAAASAVTIALVSAAKDRRALRLEGALAVYAAKETISRIKAECWADLRYAGNMDEEELEQMGRRFQNHVKLLDVMIQPKYAAFDRGFVREVIRAKDELEAAATFLTFGFEMDDHVADHITNARKALIAARPYCDRAMEHVEATLA